MNFTLVFTYVNTHACIYISICTCVCTLCMYICISLYQTTGHCIMYQFMQLLRIIMLQLLHYYNSLLYNQQSQQSFYVTIKNYIATAAAGILFIYSCVARPLILLYRVGKGSSTPHITSAVLTSILIGVSDD